MRVLQQYSSVLLILFEKITALKELVCSHDDYHSVAMGKRQEPFENCDEPDCLFKSQTLFPQELCSLAYNDCQWNEIKCNQSFLVLIAQFKMAFSCDATHTVARDIRASFVLPLLL